jgi:hypothetical protein
MNDFGLFEGSTDNDHMLGSSVLDRPGLLYS